MPIKSIADVYQRADFFLGLTNYLSNYLDLNLNLFIFTASYFVHEAMKKAEENYEMLIQEIGLFFISIVIV